MALTFRRRQTGYAQGYPLRLGVIGISPDDDEYWMWFVIHTARMSLVGALLFLSGAAQAVECGAKTAGETPFTVCRVDLKVEELVLFWRDEAGQPYRQFSALREALRVKGQQLVFAVNAGMYHPDFSPVGLFVADGREFVPLNHHVGSGNFSQQPNGVFLIEGHSARVMTTDEYASEHPKPLLATQSGPMLVHEGEITTSAVMNPKSTWRKIRNGVCAPSSDAVLFVISEAPVTFFEFASYFHDSLHCREALYLDGTISSLYAPRLTREDRGSEMGPILGVINNR
jgi:uncharacterized protein YigE (DUF2233 family)